MPGERKATLDPEKDRWLWDHCPTYVIPALPMMSILDRLSEAGAKVVSDKKVVGLRNVELNRWVSFASGPVKMKTVARLVEQESEKENEQGNGNAPLLAEVALEVWRESPDPRLSRFDRVAGATVLLADSYPGAPALPGELKNARKVDSPYSTGAMFHGPAFQMLTELSLGEGGASAVLAPERSGVPFGFINQGLLDAATHAIPADELHLWSDDISKENLGYPSRVLNAHFYQDAPRKGEVQVEARFEGFYQDPALPAETKFRFPKFRLVLIYNKNVWADFELVYALFPKGPIGLASPEKRRDFLNGAKYVKDVHLSEISSEGSELTVSLSQETVRGSDWLTGTVARAYRARVSELKALTGEVAVKEYVSRKAKIHPALVEILESPQDVSDGRVRAVAANMPYNIFTLARTWSGETARVRAVTDTTEDEYMDISPVRNVWRDIIGSGPWPGEDIFFALMQKFVRRFIVEDPVACQALKGRPALFLGNHQVGIESLLFAPLAGAWFEVPLKTISKYEHQDSYVGTLIKFFMTYPGVKPPESIIYFKEEDQASFFDHLENFKRTLPTEPRSLMVHAEATRANSARHEVTILSAVLVELALELNFPIVPVWFAGGLSVEYNPERIEFPVGYGSQDYHIGAPLLPEELERVGYKERLALVLAAINRTGPDYRDELPNAPDPDFEAKVKALMAKNGGREPEAVFRLILEQGADLSPDMKRIIQMMESGEVLPEQDDKSVWMNGFTRWLGESPG